MSESEAKTETIIPCHVLDGCQRDRLLAQLAAKDAQLEVLQRENNRLLHDAKRN